MSSHTAEFVEVASEGDLTEGAMQAVQVDGRRVLLALVEGRPYAIGAICTHERANLDEGALMGHEVYCPLHFSCFDVRTGEALAPPADRSTTVYAVKVEDGKVLVSSEPVEPEMLEAAADEPEQPGEPAPPAPSLDRNRPAPAEPAVACAPAAPGPVHARMLASIERLGWLESASEWLGTALRPIREGRRGGRLFDLLHGRILGHALHPALSDLPIGMWAGALLLDAFGEHDAALILAAAGVVAGLATAATGAADWTVSDGRDRRVGLMHGILQTVALAIVCASLAFRFGDALVPGVALLLAGFALSAGSAYLGGHLVFGRGVMVDHTAWQLGPRQWTRAIAVDGIAEGAVEPVEVEGRKVLISRSDGTISAIEAACTHAGGPLAMGRVSGGVVTCPWHGSCFRLRDGAVLKGPAAHPQPMLETRVRDGWIEVCGRRR
jgi:nitrite reductase/ring-hydroxylating ferredoxin subunit/uncharacterized membrane protein